MKEILWKFPKYNIIKLDEIYDKVFLNLSSKSDIFFLVIDDFEFHSLSHNAKINVIKKDFSNFNFRVKDKVVEILKGKDVIAIINLDFILPKFNWTNILDNKKSDKWKKYLWEKVLYANKKIETKPFANENNLVIFGLGPHSKRIYFSKLKKNIRLIVELMSKKSDVISFLNKNNLKIDTYFIKNSDANNMKLSNYDKSNLIFLIEKNKITKSIISTKPKAHYSYIKFSSECLLDQLIDKPIFVVKNHISDRSSNYRLIEMFNTYKQYYLNANKSFISTIQEQRRWHKGYLFIMKEIKKNVEKYNTKISSINLHYSDGNWNVDEYKEMENHPFKYGYGEIMHSGYHFIDLLMQLIKINGEFKNLNIQSVARKNKHIFNYYKNAKLKNKFYNDEMDFLDSNSEEDVFSLIDFDYDDGYKTIANISIEGAGPSRGFGYDKAVDNYKGNGRIRHESLVIKIGHLVTFHVHSYQSKEISERDTNSLIEENEGGLEHFDITIYRNKDLISGKSYEKIKIRDLFPIDDFINFKGYNEQARFIAIDEFMNSKLQSKYSNLLSHCESNELISRVYNSLIPKGNDDNIAHKKILENIKTIFKEEYLIQGSFILKYTFANFRKINDVDVIISNNNKKAFFEKINKHKYLRKISHDPNNNKIWYANFKIGNNEYNYDFILVKTPFYKTHKVNILDIEVNAISLEDIFFAKFSLFYKIFIKENKISQKELFDINCIWNELSKTNKIEISVLKIKNLFLDTYYQGIEINKINKLWEMLTNSFLNDLQVEDYINELNKYMINNNFYIKNSIRNIFKELINCKKTLSKMEWPSD